MKGEQTKGETRGNLSRVGAWAPVLEQRPPADSSRPREYRFQRSGFRPHFFIFFPIFIGAATRNMIGYALSIWAVAAIGGYLPYVGEHCCSRSTSITMVIVVSSFVCKGCCRGIASDHRSTFVGFFHHTKQQHHRHTENTHIHTHTGFQRGHSSKAVLVLFFFCLSCQCTTYVCVLL